MKKLYFMLLLLPYSIFAQTQHGYIINGQLPGLKDGQKISMLLFYDNGFKHDVVNTSYAKDGKFSFKGFVPDGGPRLYWLDIGFDYFGGAQLHLLINNGDNITIHPAVNFQAYVSKMQKSHSALGFIDNLVSVEGSASNYLYYDRLIWNFKGMVNQFDAEIYHLRDSIGFNGPLVQNLINERNKLSDGFGRNNLVYQRFDMVPAIPLLIAMNFESGDRPAFLKQCYDNLPDSVKNTYYGKVMDKYASLSTGQPFPEFSLPTLSGEKLALKDIYTRSKLTIVQFWASTSLPVMLDASQGELKKYYNKYHRLGLNVVSVSSDTSALQWKNAAANLPWYNVSDLKGPDGIVEKTYMEYGQYDTHYPNTTTVILDNKGTILAWDVNVGPELQWYLWHYLESHPKPQTKQTY